MLKWLGSKVDHPLADPKQARALVSDLPPNDSARALDLITRWLETLADTEGLKPERLFEIVELLDSSAKNHHRKILQDYLAMSRQQKSQEQKLWTLGFKFAKALGDAYQLCARHAEGALRKQLPLIVARSLRALALQVKWIMLRYGPFEPRLWTSIGELYQYAEKGGFTSAPVTIYPGLHGNGTVQQEYLKVLVLWASSADSLSPLKQEIAERAIAHFADSFRLETTQFAGAHYCFDPARDRPPTRQLGNAAKKPGLHCFGPGDAHAKLAQLIPLIEKSETLPAEFNLGRDYPVDVVLAVLKHLALYWSEKPPARIAQRRAATTRITVVPSFSQLLDELEREESDALNFSVPDAESWVVENESDNGYGAMVPAATTDWIRVGELIGVQLEGASGWAVALVRRVVRDDKRQYHVGIEIISRAATLVRIAHDAAAAPENAILLSAKPDAQGEVGALLRAGRFDAGHSLNISVDDQPHLLMPLRMVEAGEDFDLAIYKVLRKET